MFVLPLGIRPVKEGIATAHLEPKLSEGGDEVRNQTCKRRDCDGIHEQNSVDPLIGAAGYKILG